MDVFFYLAAIIPARNEERNLEEVLISILTQDYRDFEVLVVNDRSTDGYLARNVLSPG